MNTELLSERLPISRNESAYSLGRFCQPQNGTVIIPYLMKEGYYPQIYQSLIGKDGLE